MQTDEFESAEADPRAGLLPALTIVLHPDLDRVGDRVLLQDLGDGAGTALSRDAPGFGAVRGARVRPIDHVCVSRTPVFLARAPNGGMSIRRGDSRTKLVLRGRPVERSVEVSSASLRRGSVLTLGGRIVLLLHLAAPSASAARRDDGFGLVGESDGIERVRADIHRVADLDVPVLIRGETGTGKELVAQAVHAASARRSGPFVAVNLGAIAPELAAAELFGAERGAFTGAVQQKPGYFSAARGGTLFLDEIGEAPPSIQAALLRALQTGEIQPVGAQRASQVNVRVVAATDADLEAKVQAGTFRGPLLHRLSSYEIAVPPLRERRDDVGRLLLGFFREELARVGEAHRLATMAGDAPWLPASLVARLVDLDWPGNVRQLQNIVRQIVIASRGEDRIRRSPALERILAAPSPASESRSASSAAHDGPRPAKATSATRAEPPKRPAPASSAERRKPGEATDEEIAEVLRAHRWDLVATAAALRVSRASLYVRIQRSPRLRTAGSLSPEEIARCYRECGGVVDRMVDRLEVSEKALRRRMRELGLDES